MRLPRRVGHHVCLGPTGDANVDSPALFWPKYRRLKLWNYFFPYQIGTMKKPIENKKMFLIFIFNIYFSENIKYLRGILGELFCDPKGSNNIFTLKYVEYLIIKNLFLIKLCGTFLRNPQNTFTPKLYELRTWNFERMFTFLHVSHVICHMLDVPCHISHFISQVTHVTCIFCLFVFWIK